MARLRFTSNARNDLTEIAEFIETEGGRSSAGRVVASIRRTCRHLTEMPTSGRLRPELAANLRSFVSAEYGYVVLYRLRPGIVEVVAIVHGARDIDAAMEQRGQS